MWNRDIANSSPDIDAANGVLEGSPLTLTLSLIHTLNFVVSQTPCLCLWPEKTTHVCLIMRLPYSDPVGSAHTQCCTCEVPDLFVTSNRSIGICLTLLLLLRTTSLCRVVLPLTVILYIYSYLVRTSHKCHNSLFQSPRSMGYPDCDSPVTCMWDTLPDVVAHCAIPGSVLSYLYCALCDALQLYAKHTGPVRWIKETTQHGNHGPPLLPWSWRHLTTYSGWAVGEIQMHHISIKHTKIGSCSKDKRR